MLPPHRPHNLRVRRPALQAPRLTSPITVAKLAPEVPRGLKPLSRLAFKNIRARLHAVPVPLAGALRVLAQE